MFRPSLSQLITANPLGVKGAGKAGAVGAPPAVINAIVDALQRRVGLRHIDMPATPRVYGECSMEFEYIAEIRTLGWTHIGHCVLMGQKQATHGKKLD